MSSGFSAGFSSVTSVIIGEGLTVYNTYAELAATSPDDGSFGLVASGIENEPRLFVRSGGAWVASGPREWSTSATGSTGERALRAAAGEAIAHGDLGLLGDGLVLYAAVDGDRQVVWVPQTLPGGVRLGVTHEAVPIHFELFRDPTENATSVGETANTTIDYDTTVADRIAIYAGTDAADNAVLRYAVTVPSDADGYVVGVLGCDVLQSSVAGFLLELRAEYDGSVRRIIVQVDDNALGALGVGKWMWQADPSSPGTTGGFLVQRGSDATVEQDRLWYVDTDAGSYVYQDWPSPSGVEASSDTDDFPFAVFPSIAATAELSVTARDDNPATRVTMEGFFALAIEAIP